MRNFFADIETVEEAKTYYRIYAKTLHPDVGGDPDVMAEVNIQYKNILLRLGSTGRAESPPQAPTTSHVHEDVPGTTSQKKRMSPERKESLRKAGLAFLDSLSKAFIDRQND